MFGNVGFFTLRANLRVSVAISTVAYTTCGCGSPGSSYQGMINNSEKIFALVVVCLYAFNKAVYVTCSGG